VRPRKAVIIKKKIIYKRDYTYFS